jgi:hypothetical protein
MSILSPATSIGTATAFSIQGVGDELSLGAILGNVLGDAVGLVVGNTTVSITPVGDTDGDNVSHTGSQDNSK